MVTIHAVYDGDLRCRVIHGPTGHAFVTDAPTDNQGKGEAFAPTDLMAASLASCVLTVMGIVAKRHGWDLTGAKAEVRKEMSAEAPRRIRRLDVTVTFERPVPDDARAVLERTASACPVHHSLHPDIEAPVRFVYPPTA
jgi:uncharacterized OsmC-like protein